MRNIILWSLSFTVCLLCAGAVFTSFTTKNTPAMAKNVLGTELKSCCFDPLTGFYRNGFCDTGYNDAGVHVVCARLTKEFLDFSSSCGNDLVTPLPQFNFPGLKPGDQWCLCAARWREAMEAGVAPPVVLESTHEKALEFVTMEDLRKHELKAEK